MTKQTTHIWAEVQSWIAGLQFKPSQARLAESVGVARSAISDWKFGKTTPTPAHLAALARVMNPSDPEPVYDRLLAAVNRDQGYVPMPEEGGGGRADRSAANNPPEVGPAHQPATDDDYAVAADEQQHTIEDEQHEADTP